MMHFRHLITLDRRADTTMIKQELDRIKERISNKDFLENKGLSNEVGIHVFCYKAEDELIVQDYIRKLKSEVNTPYRIIECDLYEVFLSLLEDKRILKSVAGLEEKRGKKYLLDQLQKIATPEALLAKMDYSPHIKGQDVLFMTGIGKFIRLCVPIRCLIVCSISLKTSLL